MTIDRAGLAGFLRHRRAALQPEDVGLPRGRRRRIDGLRREEVAVLAHMSPDYYARLERGTGPQPSEQMVAAIAQGLHLSVVERDHLFRLAGHHPPQRGASSEHISPGLLRVFDRLQDTPAEIVTELGETLRQTPLGVALTGETTELLGPARSLGFGGSRSRRVGGCMRPRTTSSSRGCGCRSYARLPPCAAVLRGLRSSPRSCSIAATSSASCGTGMRSGCGPRRPSTSSILSSASWSSRARRSSIPPSRTRFSSIRRFPARRATRSCSCSPSSRGRASAEPSRLL